MLVCRQCGASYRGSIRRCPFDGGELAEAGDPLLGTLLAGRYQLSAVLGQGAFSVVYRAEDRLSLGEVAVKVLAPELTRSRSARERFAREARAVARLDHPGIVRVLDVVLAEAEQPAGGGPASRQTVALVMPVYAGETLKDRMQRSEGAGLAALAGSLVRELAGALDAAHAAGIVHRDVKPSNVMLQQDGSAVLIDFGLARLQDEVGLTETGDLVGSPAYMAPEQVRGEAPSPAVDHYALGCLWYELVAGEPPFNGSAAEVLDSHLERAPPELTTQAAPEDARLVRELLAKEPWRRVEAFECLRPASAPRTR